MSHDPKLKKAMAEIIGILKKHDIAGHITLVSETYTEMRSRIDPSWSCAFFEHLGEGLSRICLRSKTEDYPSREEQIRCQGLTANMIFQFCDMAALTFEGFHSLTKELEKSMGIEHHPLSGSGFEPHREQ